MHIRVYICIYIILYLLNAAYCNKGLFGKFFGGLLCGMCSLSCGCLLCLPTLRTCPPPTTNTTIYVPPLRYEHSMGLLRLVGSLKL